MNRNQNWVAGERIVIVRKKRVDLFVRSKNRASFYELKSSACGKFLEEGSCANMKNTKMKHVKRVGTLVGVRVPFASK